MKIVLWTAVCAIMMMASSCSIFLSVDDECEVDTDCRSLGEDLGCIKHLCVSIDDAYPEDTNTGIETSTYFDAGIDADIDTVSDMDKDTDTYTNTDSDTDTDADTGTDTNSDSSSKGDIDTDSGTDTATDSAPIEPLILHRFTFTDGLENFLHDGKFSHDAENGYAAAEFIWDAPGQNARFRLQVGPVDWSDVTDVNVVLNLEGPSVVGVGCNIYIADSQWRWCYQWYEISDFQGWSTLTLKAADCASEWGSDYMSDIDNFGIQCGTTEDFNQPVEQFYHVQIDEIYIRYVPSQDTAASDAGTPP